MKKNIWLILVLLMGISPLMLESCLPAEEEEELIEDETQIDKYRKDIIGLWQEDNTQEYWRFKSDGTGSKESPATGKYWDEADDITEDEAEPFQWYIETTGLMIIHSIGGDFCDPDPEAPFKFESLTASKMVWKGSDGTYHYFTRK